MARARPTETVTLHFDLNHAVGDGAPREFTLRGDGKGRKLVAHTEETRRTHAQQNPALAAMPAEQLQRLSHYCADVAFPTDAVAWRWVGYPAADSGARNDDVAMVFQRVSSEAVRRSVDALRVERGAAVPSLLADYGVVAPDDDTHADVHVAASAVITPGASALAIVQQHPEIASFDPAAFARIQLVLKGLSSMTALWGYISTHMAQDDPEPWYVRTVCTNPNQGPGQRYFDPGAPLRPAAGLLGSDKQPIPWNVDGSGPVLEQFKLSDGVAGVAKPVIQDALRLLKQDSRMKGVNWTKQHGVTVKERTGGHPAPASFARLAAVAEPQAPWTLKNTTSQYGLDLYPETLQYENGKLSFEVKNWPNRGLGVSWLAKDSAGTRLPAPYNAPKYLQMIGSGNVIFGIPIWTDNAEIEIDVPAAASEIDVLLGGIGQGSPWMEVDWQGIVYTSFVSYGIPSFLSVLSVGAPTCKPLVEAMGGFLDVLIPLGQELLQPILTGTGEYSLSYTLSLAAEVAAGILLSKYLETFALELLGYATAEEIAENCPFVGWVLRVASIAAAIADMIATSVEVGLSPMTYVLEAKRSMTLSVTVEPDPTHGTGTQKPIWPKEADHWVITVQYRGGTTLRKGGAMPTGEDAPIDVLFSKATNDDLPSAPADQFQILALVYSRTNWICGKWVSGWITAVPNDGDGRSESGSIIQQLVPLTPSTSYEQIQKLAYDGPSASYVWQDVTQPAPAGTRADLDKQDVSALVDITINDIAYKLGYCYQARNQNLPLDYGTAGSNDPMYLLKSVSTLAHPGAGMKASDRGFSGQPYLAYDQFGPAGLFELDAQAYEAELNASKSATAVPADLGNAFEGHGYALPAGATVVVVTSDARWLISAADGTQLFDLRRQLDLIKVLAAPAPEFSPSNFYLDSRTYATDKLYHLRQVDLHDDSGATFDPAPGTKLQSWGAFDMPNLDAIAVHPDGYAIGINYHYDQMAILKLPDQAVDDAAAPHALPMSGQGLREGLMLGPCAMTITADGRILVLEKTAARIQAFDVFANPSQCFAAELAFDLAPGFAADLDDGAAGADGAASLPLLQALQRAVPILNSAPGAFDPRYLLMPVVTAGADVAAALDAGTVNDELRLAFEKCGLELGAMRQLTPAAAGSAPAGVAGAAAGLDVSVATTEPGSLWIVTDNVLGVRYDVRLNQGEVEVFRAMTPIISVQTPGAEWLIRDKTNTLTFDVKRQTTTAGASVLHAVRLQACLRLKTGTSASTVYLDLAVESKGFIYVLSYENPSGGTLSPGDYRLDIYNPDGTPLSPDPRTRNGTVNAERMILDQWRTLFTLDYEQMAGQAGRPEPTISQWIPKEEGSGS